MIELQQVGLGQVRNKAQRWVGGGWGVKVVQHHVYLNIKTFLQKVLLQIGLKKFLWLKKLKIQFCGHM